MTLLTIKHSTKQAPIIRNTDNDYGGGWFLQLSEQGDGFASEDAKSGAPTRILTNIVGLSPPIWHLSDPRTSIYSSTCKLDCIW